VTQFEKEVDTIRVGEISPSMLDHLQVDMGGSVPLKAVAQVAKVDGRTLLVTVFDKSMASQVGCPALPRSTASLVAPVAYRC
jgi:ribosome recycling factor